ncbi:MAG: DNA methyltransferase [Rhodospirillales bacterium]|nr:DNA methyltransferase [Rhodospirillales bacterium]MDE0379106.1 DNA methyltransferase [Rhodospirillales bacterium]
MNRLYYGDCLAVMEEMPPESVDLIYLDPPFNSSRDYNAIYTDETGRPLPTQVEAFCDTWILDEDRERAIRRMPILMREAGIDDEVAEFWRLWVKALRKTNPRMLAYLSYMVQRLLPMRGLLKPTGSIYLHCDPTASHYIKIMMDAIFGHENFRNEITWQRTESHNTADRYGNIADILLYYAKSGRAIWNPQYQDYGEAQLSRFRHMDNDGRRYKLENLTAPRPNSTSGKFNWRGTLPGPTRGWGYNIEQLESWWHEGRIRMKADGSPRTDGLKVYLDETQGKPLQNIWTDISRIPNTSAERMGYATQKPLALLERVIMASSEPGDLVFDPFCGCATTIEAAHRLGRRWIGIDIAIHAIKRVAKVRLQERLRLVEGADFEIKGMPRDMEGARDLWERDKYHFQKWAVEQVDGFVTARKSGDGGIDGRLYFAMPQEDAWERDPLRSMVIEVKGGTNVGIGVVRNLRGILEREEADMAGLIVLDEPGEKKRASFGREMAAAGDLQVHGTTYPRMQLLTVSEMLEGKRFMTPSAVGRGSRQQPLALEG